MGGIADQGQRTGDQPADDLNDGVAGGQRESDGEGLLMACPRAADPRSVRMPVTTRRHVGLPAVIVVVAA
jgi:hypothetical protein